MKRKIKVRPRAEADLASAVRWYERRQSGLGEDFLASVEEAFDRIAENPLAYAEITPGVRRVLVKRFPYAVVYVADVSPIPILAVFHCFQEPEDWQLAR